VVPVYGDGRALEELVSRAAATLDPPGHRWELVLVNDGSPPATWRLIQRLSARRPGVRGINLRRNFGQQNALLAGIRASRGRVVVTLDDDLQHPPELVPRLLAALGDDVDLVYGTAVAPRHGRARAAGALVVRAALRTVLGAPVSRHVTAFRAFRGDLREALAEHRSPRLSIDVLLNWATDRVAAVPVAHEARRHGRSHQTAGRLLALVTSMVTGFSPWPLRLAGLSGLALVGLGGAALVAAGARSPLAPAGLLALASLVAVLAGVQLLAIALLGEYVALIYFRSMDRPAYVVESTTGQEDEGGRGGPL
jgi:undecaprenyl-phosphate 4-deoxy-4-formamido-L-arabinose transferase